jgi:hypothetical protein
MRVAACRTLKNSHFATLKTLENMKVTLADKLLIHSASRNDFETKWGGRRGGVADLRRQLLVVSLFHVEQHHCPLLQQSASNTEKAFPWREAPDKQAVRHWKNTFSMKFRIRPASLCKLDSLIVKKFVRIGVNRRGFCRQFGPVGVAFAKTRNQSHLIRSLNFRGTGFNPMRNTSFPTYSQV